MSVEPTSTTPGHIPVTLREFELWQKAQANEAVLRQTMLEEARGALEKLVDARFDAAQLALKLALESHVREHVVADRTQLRERQMVREILAQLRAADQTAIAKAEDAVNTRLEGMNELRSQIASERGEYVRQDTYSARQDEVMTRQNAMETALVQIREQMIGVAGMPTRINALENGSANLQGRITVAVAVSGVVITIILTFVVIAVNLIVARL